MLIGPAIYIFALAAVSGLALATEHFRGGFPSVGGAIVHGTLASIGLIFLFIAVFMQGATGPTRWALCILSVAGLGGFVLALGFHSRQRRLSPGLVVGHGLIAAVGLIILLLTV
jgi:hypothetical protein